MSLRSKILTAAPFFFLLALLAQGLWAAADKAPAADEMAHHVASGHSYLVTRDFRMNPASPPLPRMLAAVPLLFTRMQAPLHHDAWKNLDAPGYARQFFYHSGEDADTLIFLARIPILLLSAGLGWLIYVRALRYFGPEAALGALCLYCFCPDVLAHSSLATADLSVSLFMAWCIFSFHDYLSGPNLKLAARAGALCGLALLSKYSAVLLFIILPIMAFTSKRAWALKIRPAIIFFITCFVVVWAGYFFEMKPLLDRTPDPAKKALVYRKIGGEPLLRFAEKIPVPCATFASSLASMVYTRSVGTNAFLMGEWSRGGWPWYYAVAFGIKNTVPFVLFALGGLAWLIRKKSAPILKSVLLAPLLIFFILTLRDKAQAGIRYFLPVYPMVCVCAGGLFSGLWKRGGLHQLYSGGLLLLHAASAILCAPNYLSYFNLLAGGSSNGYQWLRDSNLDWGQDLKPLARYLKKTASPRIALYYPWPADPAYYKIDFREVGVDELSSPKSEIYAISAHFLDNFKWTKQEKPFKKIGNSIFLYDLRNK